MKGAHWCTRDIELQDYLVDPAGSYTYNLIANIVHDGQHGAGKGSYRTHIFHQVRVYRLYLWNADANQPTGDWYEMQDLHVTKILPQMITLSEPYIQVSFLRYNRGVT